MIKASVLAGITALGLVCSGTAIHAEMSPEEVKKLALEAILENPEIVMQAVDILREREAREKAEAAELAMKENWSTLTSVENAAVIGNPEGDITIIEFFDYNCGYCKRSAAHVQELLETDKNVRVILREFPILSETSVTAAKASLAARKQGKYEEFHWMLMRARGLTDASILQMAQEAGLNADQLKTDMEAPDIQAHLETSHQLATAMGITGTPSFVIGDQLVPGYVPLEEMQSIIAAERKGG